MSYSNSDVLKEVTDFIKMEREISAALESDESEEETHPRDIMNEDDLNIDI